MKKWSILLLVLILLLVGCSSDKEDEPNDKPEPTPSTSSTPVPIESVDGVTFELNLNQSSEGTSQLVAKALNNSNKTIKTIKINVNYVDENVNRILYLSQLVNAGEESSSFFISGPASKLASDIVVSDVIVTFEDDSTAGSGDKPSPNQPTPSQPDDSKPDPKPDDETKPEPDPVDETPSQVSDEMVNVDSSKLLQLHRFSEEFILQMADLSPTIGMVNNQVVVSFKNNSEFPIKTYQIRLNLNDQVQSFNYEGVVGVGESSPQFGFIDAQGVSLEQITGNTLKVIADYGSGQNLSVEYDLASPSASYQIQ